MDQKPKRVDTNLSPMQPQPPRQWLNYIKTFLDVPNPIMVRLLLVSSLATFFSSIAFFFEWVFHGKNHAGFEWIIYYALFLFFLLILVWFVLGVIMASHGSKQVGSSTVEEKNNVDVSAIRCGDEEAKDNKCRSLALVVDSDTKMCKEKRLFQNKTTKLKRAVSFPLHSQVRSCRTR